MTTDEAGQEIARDLESGERVLWSGVPRQGLMLRGSDALLIPFSVMWGGFAISWEVTALKMRAGTLFDLWGIPFVAIGLYLMVGRFFVDANQRARMAYGLTDRRVIIVSGLQSRTVKSLPLKTLAEVTLEEKSDRSGTIAFGPVNPYARFGGGWPASRGAQAPAFEGIAQARVVHRRIMEAQKALDVK
jgi:hypothetical protein